MSNKRPVPLFDNLSLMQATPELQQDHPIFDVVDEKMATKIHKDYLHAHVFLWSYRGSQATFNAYRRDIERLLQWAWLIQGVSVTEFNRDIIELYVEFCRKPPKSWVASAHKPRYTSVFGRRVPNQDWRPFVCKAEGSYILSPTALSSLLAVLSTFFQFLIAEQAISMNPVALIRQKSKFVRKDQQKKVHRRLSKSQWTYVIETAELMSIEMPEKHHRTLFIMNALYGMYLRISELVASERWTPEMSDFHQDHRGNWWFVTVGKGNKMREISVSPEMLQALRRYRIAQKLSPLPSPDESTPLILALNGKGPLTGTRHIRKIVQECFDRAKVRMQEDGLHDDAHALSAATVHWLRHTGISDDIEWRPREHVRDDAGHSSSVTTDRYVDISEQERAESAKHKTLRPDSKN